jgi:lipoprotein NlpD
MNDIAPPYRIYVGQSIRLKNSASRRAASTQAMTQSAPIQRQTVPLPQNTVPAAPAVSAQNQTAPAVRAQSSSLRWVKPSNGSVIAKFNLASNVKGVRFGGKAGDPIYAAADGQVVYAADGLKEYGNLILLKHINGYITAYAHNSKMIVKSGDNVQAGQKIAEMGSTGTSGTMLEFQVRLDGKPVNPEMVLPLN